MPEFLESVFAGRRCGSTRSRIALACLAMAPLAAAGDAWAGDRAKPAPVRPSTDSVVRAAAPSRGHAPIVTGIEVRASGESQRSSAFDLRTVPRRPLKARTGTAGAAEARLSQIDHDWASSVRSSDPADRDGCRRAVREAMADHPRTGPPRRMLDALLVFRIDGDAASPSFSVDGGVAGILWEAGTRH